MSKGNSYKSKKSGVYSNLITGYKRGNTSGPKSHSCKVNKGKKK